MQRNSEHSRRLWEILTGGFLILLAFSFVASLLLDFRFVSPDASPQEDLDYLSESIPAQKTSSWAWLLTSLLTLACIPFYLAAFHRRLRFLHIINAIFMMFASAGFLMMAKTGLELESEMVGFVGKGIDWTLDRVQFSLLEKYSQEQIYRRMGSSFVGMWAIGIGLSRIRARLVPAVASFLLLASGPTLIVFNWIDPEHLLRTVAMTGIITGVMIFCVRLINRGLQAPSG